jgi:hypothetical protein
MPKRDASGCGVAKRLSNFSGIVFEYRRKADPGKYESLFRSSLEVFLTSVLPEQTPQAIAADIVEEVREWVKGFYDKVPRDLWYPLNDVIMNAYEAHRRKLDTTEQHGLMLRFVEDNKELISLQVSDAVDYIRKRWEEIYTTHHGVLPEGPSPRLISGEVRTKLRKAVLTNDPMMVRDVLAPLEIGLIDAVRKALIEVSFDLRESRRRVTDYSGRPTAEFEAARRMIRRNNPRAVASFSEIWNRRRQDSHAKEWYAYALAKVDKGWRRAKDLLEEIRKAARGDDVTDWNVACCEINLGDRESAFHILRERVESGIQINGVLEAAVLLALEYKDKQFLAKQLDWLPLEEAILLGYLCAADVHAPSDELEAWLSAIEVIASDSKGFIPPDPAERLAPPDLNDLCFAFIQRRMVRGGITWFRRRVSFDEHRHFYLNWQLLGDLCLQGLQLDDAVDAYDKRLEYTNRANVPANIKRQAMEEILETMVERDLVPQAKKILIKYASMLPSEDYARWSERTQEESQQKKPPSPPVEKTSVTNPSEEIKPLSHEPLSKLIETVNRLLVIRRIDDFKGDLSPLSDAASGLYEVWPAYSRKLVDQIRTEIEHLHNFDSSSDLKEKERSSQLLRENLTAIDALLQEVTEPALKEKAAQVVTVLRRLAEDASFQANVVRSIEIDWHLNGYLPDRTFPPLKPKLPKTSLLLRVTNRGTEQVNDIEVYLQGESGKVKVAESCQHLGESLGVEATTVLRFPVDYDVLDTEESFLTYARFSAGGVTNLSTPAKRFDIRPASFAEKLGGRDRIQDAFFVGVGIPDDRRDIFHGRGREQRRIADSLRGNVQSEVLFLNGPRRVGKTSILNSLRWALPELGLNEIIPVSLSEEIPQSTGAFLEGIAREILKAVNKHLCVEDFLQPPATQEFYREPTVAFRFFCETAQQKLAPRRILLMFDETQRLAQAIKNGRIDDNVLGLFSTLMSRNSGVLFVFTASVLFRDVRDLSPNQIWGRLAQFPTGFLNADAVNQVVEAGVKTYPVEFTPEALHRIWEMTEGHPWIVQAIGKRIISEVLNPQQRLTVGPGDVDQAVEFIEDTEDQYCRYWWNEKREEGGFIDETDWEIARVIIEQQSRQGSGLPKSVLFQHLRHIGKPINNERINKLVDMQTLAKEVKNGEEHVRIRGLFLERWLKNQITTGAKSHSPFASAVSNVALFVDHENLAISMRRFVEQLPPTRQAAWAPLADPVLLARRLAQHAGRFGTLVHRVAVATWKHFIDDLSAYSQAMFSFDQPLGGKNTSDERLKQLIRDTLEQEPDVGVYIIGTGDADFRDTIQTLLKRNKKVILWGFRAIGSVKSNMSSVYREMGAWQNLGVEPSVPI